MVNDRGAGEMVTRFLVGKLAKIDIV